MSRLRVVLHRPVYPRNVGMSARAAANMGVDRLIVVDPAKPLDHVRAKQGASHAQDVLANATVYASLDQFHAREGDGIRIALSGREGADERNDSLEDVMRGFAQDPSHRFHDPSVPIYLMFGTENNGLSNEEMRLCHHVCRLPTYGRVTSLNLSHAVLLALSIVKRYESTPGAAARTAEDGPLYHPGDVIKRWLEELGFDLSAKRVNMENTLTRILLSRAPSREELKTLAAVLEQTVRKLADRKRR